MAAASAHSSASGAGHSGAPRAGHGRRAIVLVASAPFIGWSLIAPLAPAPTGLTVAAIVRTLLDLAGTETRRTPAFTGPRQGRRRARPHRGELHAVVAAVGAVVVRRYELLLEAIFANRASIDPLHFSLHPLELLRSVWPRGWFYCTRGGLDGRRCSACRS